MGRGAARNRVLCTRPARWGTSPLRRSKRDSYRATGQASLPRDQGPDRCQPGDPDLRSQGRRRRYARLQPRLPPMYAFLPGFEDIQAEPPHGIDPQLVFFFDSGNLERSGSGVRRIASHATLVNVDHHPSNSRFGDINIIDPDASAVGQTVIEMLDHFGYAITRTIATNLYVALLTDTGGFRHENTTPRALEDGARLARLGADPGHIATQVYKMRPETTLKLSGLALATMRVEMDGRLAWAKVTRRMLKEANAQMAESEGIIDTLNSIAG